MQRKEANNYSPQYPISLPTMRFCSIIQQWLWLLILAGAAGCQRASYQFENPLAVNPNISSLAAPGGSATITVLGQPSITLPKYQPAASRTATRHRAKRYHSFTAKVQSLPRLHMADKSAVPTEAYAWPYNKQLPSDESGHRRTRGIAFLLAIFLGGLGAHLFYLGYHKRATTYLMLTLVGGALVFIGFILFLLALFGSGGGAAFVAPLVLGAILLNVISVLSLVDAVRILTNALKPSNGEYYPRFFQTRPQSTDQHPPR